MLSIQHILYSVIAKSELKEDEIASVVYPDAIRAYVGPRQYSHFEISENKMESSYCKFPSDMKMGKDEVVELFDREGHLVENIRPCAIGEDTNIEAFYTHNKHLPETIFNGVECHLKQDIVFDKFIRKIIDCEKKYEDIYFFNEKELDGKALRELIAKIEQHGIYILAAKLYEEQGITANQEWLERFVKPALLKAYPVDLAIKTYSFMNIDAEINTLISNHDWSKIGPIPKVMYDCLNNEVLNVMKAGK